MAVQTIDYSRMIDRVLEDELGMRQDALARATVEHGRKRLSDAELKDYQDDVANMTMAIRHWKAVRP